MEFEHKWNFDTEDEVAETFKGGDQKLHNLIVDIALDNLHTDINEIPVVSIHAKDTGMFYDIMIDRDDMLETLSQNLETMEQYEDYDRCQKIFEAINYLKLKIKNTKK
jgi:hypothetical protein